MAEGVALSVAEVIKSIARIEHVRVDDVKVVYENGVTALDGVKLDIGRGLTVLLGPNGAGKTTLLNVVSGIVMPRRGKVVLNGIFNLLGLNDSNRALVRRLHYSYLIQEDVFLEHLTVLENIVLPYKLFKMDPPLDYVQEIIEALGINHLLDRRPTGLSGGERRKVSLARALVKAKDASVVLLDEPTSNLDRDSVEVLLDIIKELRRDKVVVIATHDQLLGDVADVRVYLRGGRVESIS